MFRYLISLPERTLRATAAGAGGLAYEATAVLLPPAVRDSKIYETTVEGLLRVAVELIGDVEGILPAREMGADELFVRKAAGTGVDIAGLLTVGWSPLWVFAVAADLTGGSRAYLKALVVEFQRDELLAEDTDVTSTEELLVALENSSGMMADALDRPPLNLKDMRETWEQLSQNAAALPDANRIGKTFTLIQQVAKQEDRSVWSVSSLVAAGAARAGLLLGKTHIFDYYDQALGKISDEGLAEYSLRVARPYGLVAIDHFNPNRVTLTDRFIDQIDPPTKQP
jgi:hypothetical protein